MIGDVLSVLQESVNDHLIRSAGQGLMDSDLGHVVFTESEKVDCVDFKLGAVSLLLVNVEQEHSLRPADPYRRILADGTKQRINPAIFINAYILFVARFKDYKLSLKYISLILQFFLARPVFDHENTPTLSAGIEKLTLELSTLPFSELNNLWGILRTAYQPSLLYKVRMVAFADEAGLSAPLVQEVAVSVNR